ncbi:DUF3667 domain-containing protein [Rheinheimera sp. NSM]|uniref:DUF3667 domain-containing protein n=1 Tax=Rheinheimera sp. NSM TaxID=3457884 RepID=UPI0040361E9C
MDTAVQQYCDNCHTSLQGEFCHQCGQEKKSYIRNVSGVVSEFFGEFSNWDARVWRTLLPLWFRPGYLSSRYVQGHRVPYVPPLRLYLFTSIIAFLIFAKLLPDTPINITSPDQTAMQQAQDIEQGRKILSEVMAEVKHDLQQDQQQTPFDSRISFLSDEAQQQFDTKLAAIVANPKLAINKFFSLAPQMMFLLLPLFALLLKLLYIRSERYFMEHLIVALHSHSFILQMSVFYLALSLLPAYISWPWLAAAVSHLAELAFIWMPLYLLLCQKFYYRQSWGKTLVKFWLTSSFYMVLAMSAVMGLIVLSILWA